MMKLTLCRVPMRSRAPCSAEAVHDQITVRSSRKKITSTVTADSVSTVRSLFRQMLRTAIVTSPMVKSSAVRATALVREDALVQAVDDLGPLGGRGIVRHHDDRLPELGVELLEQLQDLVRARAVEIAGRLE